MVAPIFDHGGIVRPVVGHEMQGDAHPPLVLTPLEFDRLGDVLVAQAGRKESADCHDGADWLVP